MPVLTKVGIGNEEISNISNKRIKAPLNIVRIPGLSDYEEVWETQREISAKVLEGAENTLILTEHKKVITIGRSGGDDNLLTPPEELKNLGFQILHSNRGGDITYHGPGQLIIYPIFNLRRHYLDVHRFLRDIEEVAIKVLQKYQIDGKRVEGRTGVWTESGKIASIGFHVKKWVTTHGMSLNVNVDLEDFNHIIACGLEGASAASIEKIVGEKVDFDEVVDKVIDAVGEVFYNS